MVKHYKAFTLVELLIAVFIFAIISLAISISFKNVLASQSVLKLHHHRLHALQSTWSQLENDIEQAVKRHVRDEKAKYHAPIEGDEHQMSITILNTKAKAHLSRVHYEVKHHTLYKVYYQELKDEQLANHSHIKLLQDVAEFRVAYLDNHGLFHKQWPPVNAGYEVMPKAIRLYVRVPQLGEMTQLYLVHHEEGGQRAKT